jgi:hypothetical protein
MCGNSVVFSSTSPTRPKPVTQRPSSHAEFGFDSAFPGYGSYLPRGLLTSLGGELGEASGLILFLSVLHVKIFLNR